MALTTIAAAFHLIKDLILLSIFWSPGDLISDSADIVFIGAPYGVRPPIYDAIRGKVKGIYCEKPFAKSVKEHLAITNDYEDYTFSIGYNRRALGHVNIIKNIIHDGVFGDLKEVRCEYGYFKIKSGSFHSHVELSGGGILFESGVHWIDAMLFSIQPNDVEIINAIVEYNAGLDIHTDAEFRFPCTVDCLTMWRATGMCDIGKTSSIQI